MACYGKLVYRSTKRELDIVDMLGNCDRHEVMVHIVIVSASPLQE